MSPEQTEGLIRWVGTRSFAIFIALLAILGSLWLGIILMVGYLGQILEVLERGAAS